MKAYEISVAHSIDAAHRVVGHEGGTGKCARLHGHTYGFTVVVQAWELDELGFVVDFGQIKAVLNEWDHRTVLWTDDPLFIGRRSSQPDGPIEQGVLGGDVEGVVRVPFNPTAENIARHFAERLLELRAELLAVRVIVSETPKTTTVWDASRI